ncbi:MAG: hypothetical protein AAF961_19120, partial [Planctomycetota bacterium]
QGKVYPPIPGWGVIQDNETSPLTPPDDPDPAPTVADDYVVFDHSVGTNGSDRMIGTDADESFASGRGNDVINGGAGTDFLVLQGSADDYFVAGSDYAGDGNYLVLNAREGQDSITNIEGLFFAGSGEVLMLDSGGSVIGDGGFLRADLVGTTELGPEDYAVFGGTELAPLIAGNGVGADGRGDGDGALVLTEILETGTAGTTSGDVNNADYLLITSPSLDDLLSTDAGTTETM